MSTKTLGVSTQKELMKGIEGTFHSYCKLFDLNPRHKTLLVSPKLDT